MSTLVDARGLVKRYGDHTVVNGIDVSVVPSTVVAIIGPNGAGKSTTLDLMVGLRTPDSGTVTYWCADPRGQIGVQLQTTPFFRGLTAAENLRLFASFYGVPLGRRQVAEMLERCELGGVARVEAAKLSGGQKKRLAIAVALAHEPRLLFLDEPTAALDPRSRREIRAQLRSLAAGGVAVVFTSHDMEEVGKLADRIILIVAGRVRAEGSPSALLAEFGASSLEDVFLHLTAAEED
jgi:ABC-2 type transport system ATP-binding protein